MYRYFLAMRYLLSRPINVLGVIGVTLGVWALILVVSIFSGFLKVFRAHVHSATSDVSVLLVPSSENYDDLARVISDHDNVAATAPRMVWYALLHGGGGGGRPAMEGMTPGADAPFVTVLGIDPRLETQVTGFREWLEAIDPEEEADLRVADLDDPLKPIDGMPSILLGRDRMLLHDLQRGDVLRLTTARRGTGDETELAKLEKEFAVAGAFATQHMGFDGLHSLLAIDEMRELLTPDSPHAVSEISIRLENPDLGEQSAGEVGALLGNYFAAKFPPTTAPPVRTWQQLNQTFLQAVDHQRSLMKMVLFVILIVAAFLMYATLSMMVTEKTRDIGILTALGGRPLGVLQVFLFCGLAITVSGVILGVLAGCLSSVYLDAFNSWLSSQFGIDLFPSGVYNLTHVPYDLDPIWIAQVCAMAMGAGLVVSGLPALRAARHSPLQSLRNE